MHILRELNVILTTKLFVSLGKRFWGWIAQTHRHLFLSSLLLVEPAPGVWAQTDHDVTPTSAQPRYTVSAQQIQLAVDQRFPLRYPVPEVVDLEVQTPRLRLLPAQDRVSVEMVVQAKGPALRRAHQGVLEVDFALRYEASDLSIRAHQLRIGRLQFPSLQPGVVALLNTYAAAMARRTLLELVLHRLEPKDLALADVVGLQPGSIAVTEAGLDISFVNKKP